MNYAGVVRLPGRGLGRGEKAASKVSVAEFFGKTATARYINEKQETTGLDKA
jgi:hypothetical protein